MFKKNVAFESFGEGCVVGFLVVGESVVILVVGGCSLPFFLSLGDRCVQYQTIYSNPTNSFLVSQKTVHNTQMRTGVFVPLALCPEA